jgi:putative hydrolase of the HAD superfamily
MLSWIFFDVGNVILNDDPAQARAFYLLQKALAARGSSLRLEDLLAERRKLVRQLGIEPTRPCFQILGKRLLGDEYPHVLKEMAEDIFPRWGELSPCIPGIREVVRGLRKRFHLGIIANQPREAVAVLKGHGLWDCFSVHGISAIVGSQKPDPAIFRWALGRARCRPEEALMIGDRLDNDILPGKTVGMKTLHLILSPDAKGFEPKRPHERAYLREKAYAHRHLSVRSAEGDSPGATVWTVAEIPEAVTRLSGIPPRT